MFKSLKKVAKSGAKMLGLGGPKANPMAKAAAAQYKARGAAAGAMTEARLAASKSKLNAVPMSAGYAKAGKVAKPKPANKPRLVVPTAARASKRPKYKPIMTVARQPKQRAA